MSDPLDELFSLPTSGKEWDLPTVKLTVLLLSQRVKNMEAAASAQDTNLKDNYARKWDLSALEEKVKLPITMVYATAGLMLIAVIGALVALVVKGHGS